MLTYRVGAGGQGSSAVGLARYYLSSEHVQPLQAALANYYGRSAGTLAIPQADMHPLVAGRLGIDPRRPLTTDELSNLLGGKRADGLKIKNKKCGHNAYIDLTFSAPKSLSVSIVFAPTEKERNVLHKAHVDAVQSIMAHIAKEIGTASIGDNTGNLDPARRRETAHIAAVMLEHYAARPTYMLAEDRDTKLYQLARGDMQVHTHALVPNIAVTDSGRATALHQNGLDQRIHEWGSLYQAFLATNLRQHGVNVELDSRAGLSFNERMARLTDVPQWICDHFSKRTTDGEKVAREIAAESGQDLDAMSPQEKAALLGRWVNAMRLAKETDGAELADWERQARELRYQHRSVLRPGQEQGLRVAAERCQQAYDVALPLVSEQFDRRAVLEGSVPRIAAAKGLIAAGIQTAGEVNTITAAMRTEGVKQDGRLTSLKWAFDPGKRLARVTTKLSADMEREAIGLLRKAAADRSTDFTSAEFNQAADRVVARWRERGQNLDFTSAHGAKQLKFGHALGTSGRAAVGIGIAGSGKSVALEVVIEAANARGRKTIGGALAWRQTEGLREAGAGMRRRRVLDRDTLAKAGLDEANIYAIQPLLRGLHNGKIQVDKNTTVILDEFALIGTKPLLDLARLQNKHGFQLIGIGDDRQNQPVEAGASINLARRAFGAENIPELLSSIRQLTERSLRTTMLWREGTPEAAAEALERKTEDNTLRIVPGGYAEAVKATVDLWWERREANKGDRNYKIGISVPTNTDALAVGRAIRGRRRLAGEVGRDLYQIDAGDQNGATYTLAVAVGDRFRLFDRVRGRNSNGTVSNVGHNGSVVEVLNADRRQMTVRKAGGKVASVAWEALRRNNGPIRLTYGDAVTIDARQSDTVTEHITAMLNGSATLNAFKTYVAESRHRVQSWLVTSHGAEKRELQQRWPLGDQRNYETDPEKVNAAIVDNMARNLSVQPTKTLAVEFLERAVNLRNGAIGAKLAAWFRPAREHPEPKMTDAPHQPSTVMEQRKSVIAEEAAVIALEESAGMRAATERVKVAAEIADGRLDWREGIDRLMAEWDDRNPRPDGADMMATMTWQKNRWVQSGSDVFDQWEMRRVEAAGQIDYRLDVLVERIKARNDDSTKPGERTMADQHEHEHDTTRQDGQIAREALNGQIIAMGKTFPSQPAQMQQDHRREGGLER